MPSIVSRIVLIFTFISALGLGLAGPAPAAMAENWQQFLSNTRTEADRIQTIVDRMLELADLQFKKQLIHRRINLDALVKTVLESKHPLLAAKQMAVQSHIAPHLKIQGDLFLLHQALANQVKEVAELHQGAIRPENIPPQGVRTTLTLGR